MLRHLFDAITFVVPAKEQHVDYYQIVKEQPIVRMLEPEGAWRTAQATFGTAFNVEPRLGISTPLQRSDGGGERDRTDDPLLAKQVLSQLSYTPETPASPTPAGPAGVLGGSGWTRTIDPRLIKTVL